MALLNEKEYILRKIEQRQVTMGIYVDFTHAFDYIINSILYKKLHHCGIRGLLLELLQNYLSHRHQFVSMNNFNSGKKKQISGAPQGSILGPLLLIVYINDIVHISTEDKISMSAYDTTIFVSAFSSDEIVSES